MTRFRSIRRVLLVLVCALILNAVALVALAATAVDISGREFFPGVHYGDATYGASFAGLTLTAERGVWAASVNYRGTAGLGHEVAIFGGSWGLAKADGSRLSGRVTGGAVVWPLNLDSTVPGVLGTLCGKGVATFNASLSIRGSLSPGSIVGCLDDTHLATVPRVFPPRIFGTLTLP